MIYKIVFSDIDGTLLNKDRELSALTKRVFRELQKDVPVVLISSRMPDAMRHLQHKLHIGHQPLICYNGALILVDGKTISSTEIPLNIVQQLHEFNKEFNCHLGLYNNDDWFVPEMYKWATREENNTKVTPVVKPTEEVLTAVEKSGNAAHQIMAMGVEEKIDKIEKLLLATFHS